MGQDAVIDQLAKENADLKDQLLRAQADMQNIRRRAQDQVEEARKFALEDFVKSLLPVADNLERAAAVGEKEDASLKTVLEGVQLTSKSLQETLNKFHVEAIDPEGKPFDAQMHQAVSMVPSTDVEPDTVLDVLQKGYILNGR